MVGGLTEKNQSESPYLSKEYFQQGEVSLIVIFWLESLVEVNRFWW